jgi:hypothetical protein
MIGDDIKQQAEPVSLQRTAEVTVSRFAAQFRVHLTGVDDVVSVQAARSRFQTGGRIKMRNTQLLQIRHQSGGSIETKVPIELDAVCGNWGF